MAHLSEDMPVRAEYTLDIIIGAIGIVDIPESDLSVGKEFRSHFLIDDKFAFSVAESDAVALPE